MIATSPPPAATARPKPTPQPQRATVQVKRGTIVDAIKVLGRVVSSREADLSFRNSGRIREVYVQPGEMVEPGQVLAELDQRTLPWDLAKARNLVEQAQVKLSAAQAKSVVDDTAVDGLSIASAEIGVEQAQILLEKVRAGAQDSDIRKAEADLAKEQAALDRARFDLRDKEVQLAAKRADLEAKERGPDPIILLQARADLELARIELEEAKAGPRPEDVRASELALEIERTKLDRLRDQPKVKAEDLENARIDVLKAQNALAKVLADIDAGAIKGEANRDTAVRAAQLALQQAQNAYDAKVAAGKPRDEDIHQQKQAVTQAELQLTKVKNPARYNVEAAQVAVTAAQTKLDQLQAPPTENELVALKTQIQALELAVSNLMQTIAVAEANVAAAQAKLDVVKRGPTDFELQDARNRLALAQNAVASTQARLSTRQQTITQTRAASGFDVEQLSRAVEQTSLDVQNYEAQTGDVKIVAPFGGRIMRLAARPGDTVQAFFPVMNVSSLEGLVVKADIAEADLPRIDVGMPVDLTMDAYPNQKLTGRIDALPEQVVGQVGPAPERATRIVVDWPGPGAEMGMLARVQITLQIKDDVLIVPNGAVRTVGKRRFVEYMDGEIKRSRNVELGIVTDQETEVTSGLMEGIVILAGQS
ncbi:MAG: efflux RND transporter periplasmic adaptor subunit [Chloroflexi bacterium]|nr:efflux RND transporter periplasmic adaptor subunit [Chloroflexota bacterium]